MHFAVSAFDKGEYLEYSSEKKKNFLPTGVQFKRFCFSVYEIWKEKCLGHKFTRLWSCDEQRGVVLRATNQFLCMAFSSANSHTLQLTRNKTFKQNHFSCHFSCSYSPQPGAWCSQLIKRPKINFQFRLQVFWVKLTAKETGSTKVSTEQGWAASRMVENEREKLAIGKRVKSANCKHVYMTKLQQSVSLFRVGSNPRLLYQLPCTYTTSVSQKESFCFVLHLKAKWNVTLCLRFPFLFSNVFKHRTQFFCTVVVSVPHGVFS